MRVKVREIERRRGQARVRIVPQVKAGQSLGRIIRSGHKRGARAETVFAVLLLGFAVLGTSAMSAAWGEKIPAQKGATSPGKSVALYNHLPLSFEPNQGQTDHRVKFLARGQGYTVFLTSDEAVLVLQKPEDKSQKPEGLRSGVEAGNSKLETRNSARGDADSSPVTHHSPPVSLCLQLVGANPSPQVAGLEELPSQTNYFIGNDPGKWRSHVPNYAKVRYAQVYPGIDLVYYGNQRQLEYDFVVAPGADPRAIRLALETGGSKLEDRNSKLEAALRVDAEGNLVVPIEGGEVRFHKPLVYQPAEAAFRRADQAAGLTPAATTDAPHSLLNSAFRIHNSQFVDGRYVLLADNRIGFEVGAYNPAQPLIIDPVLSYSTYLGGTGGDAAYGIAVDGSGDAYVTGATASTDFPTAAAVQTAAGGAGDVFVAKFNATRSALTYSTYLGGSGSDIGTGIAIDSAGNAYITGSTSSANFPTTSGVPQPNYAGNGDAFVAKLDATGSTLVYCTYLGGTNPDYGAGIVVDSAGNAFVTGSTESPDFPTVNPLQIGNDGCSIASGVVSCSSDVFVAKLNPSGTALVYSTYLGGSSADTGSAIAVDGSGNAYVSGYTYSSDFPTQNALQSTKAGGSDAFVLELNAAGSALLYSTYLGGSGQDKALGLALDASGSVYVVGETQSKDFPTIPGAFQASCRTDNSGGCDDAFVFKLGPGGSPLVYATLLGGTGTDQANGIAVDSSGNAYITGFTQSSDFPTVNPLQTILGIAGAGPCGSTLCADAFVSVLGPSGAPVYSTYLGGSGADFGQAIAVDSSGRAYVAGSTGSANFPVTEGVAQANYLGSGSAGNAFVAKIDGRDAPAAAITPQQINFGNQVVNTSSDPRTVTLVNAGSAVLNISSITASGDFAVSSNCGTALPAGGATCNIQITFTPTTTGTTTDQITITDSAAGSPHIITVTGDGVIAGALLTLSAGSLSFAAETVGATSDPQVVRLTNTGNAAVTLSTISIGGDFAQSNTCGELPSVLNVGASCTFSVTFTPTGTGSREGTLSITDDAANSPQAVKLTGTGNPVFSLSANTRSTVIVIGTTSATFTVYASAPSSFIGSITLACSSGTSCTFDPTSITGGQSSALTVSDLSATSANPLNFTVTGTSGTQTASVSLSVFLADFSLSASPALNTVTAGNSATYTVTVTPSNGFNQVVLLSCSNLPQAASCVWSPPGFTLNGTTAATATVTVTTTTQTAHSGWRPPRGDPRPGLKPNRGLWVLLLAILALLAASSGSRRRAQRATVTGLQTHLRLATLVMLVFLMAAAVGCNEYYYSPFRPAPGSGTPSGNYVIVITGTLGNNSAVSRRTTVNLTVGAG